MDWQILFTPNASIPKQMRYAVVGSWTALFLLLWQFSNLPFVPTPEEVFGAAQRLKDNGTFLEFGVSIWTMFEAIVATIVIALSLAYASTFPLFRPVISFIAGTRSWGFVGLTLFFTLIAPDSHVLKIMLLTFSIAVFYLRDMQHVVRDVPQAEFDHARTLGLSRWGVTYQVVIRGTLDSALESLRVNAAMGWMMLTAVEAIVQSEGGVGVALYQMGRHMDIPGEFALMIALYIVGMAQDFIIGFIKDKIVCPYAALGSN